MHASEQAAIGPVRRPPTPNIPPETDRDRAGEPAGAPFDPPAPSPIAGRIAVAVRTIERAEAQPRLADLARAAGLSPSHFQRLFKRIVGLSPTRYGIAVRRARLRRALENGDGVTQAIFAAGFGSASQGYAALRDEAGLTPSAIRAGGSGVSIYHLGLPVGARRLHLGFTERGLCHLSLGAERADTRSELRRLLPHARLAPLHDPGLRALVLDALAPLRAELAAATGPRERALVERLRRSLAGLRPAPHATSHPSVAHPAGHGAERRTR
ncbi:helix-turn-helix domain-containing protein [Salinarimonas chemoclinalis]|uniref:helix-turn-helix domain-containing protein n=1 Tax=Salinarimonas chemoclinalis TaxID=3241599 RepID=UPI003558DDC0